MQQQLLAHLDVWTSAIEVRSTAGRGSNNKLNLYGIKKLRELILELAVQGKLVPQDPNDEPASVLLEKIAAEKAALIKTGKLKKEKPLPPITDDEKPFALPNGWEWVRLDTITEINPRNKAEDSTLASFVPMHLISTDYSGKHEHEIRSWKEIKKGYTHFATGDIAVAKITPCFENSKAAIFKNLKNGIGAGTTELHVARPFGNTLIQEYILLYLKSPMFLLVGETKMTGTAGQKRLPREFFEGNPVPLPPLAEQQRIVAKVDELMALCDALEQEQQAGIQAHQTLVEQLLTALTQGEGCAWQRIAAHFDTLFTTEHSIDQLKQTILQLAVMGKLVPQNLDDEPASVLLEKIAAEKAALIKTGKLKKEKPLPPITDDEKPFALPHGWQWVRLSEFALIGTGATPARSNSDYYNPAKLNWVTSGETASDFIFSTEEKISLKAIEETNVSVYPIGTLILAMYGQGKTRGQITELAIPAGTNQACAAIQLIENNLDHRRFIKLFFQRSYHEIRNIAAGGAQPNLNLNKISHTLTPLPPLAEQQRIVAKVDELMALCDALKAEIRAAQSTQLQVADALTGNYLA